MLAPLTVPVADSSRLAVRTVARLGEMLVTSVRPAIAITLASGNMTDSARTE